MVQRTLSYTIVKAKHVLSYHYQSTDNHDEVGASLQLDRLTNLTQPHGAILPPTLISVSIPEKNCDWDNYYYHCPLLISSTPVSPETYKKSVLGSIVGVCAPSESKELAKIGAHAQDSRDAAGTRQSHLATGCARTLCTSTHAVLRLGQNWRDSAPDGYRQVLLASLLPRTRPSIPVSPLPAHNSCFSLEIITVRCFSRTSRRSPDATQTSSR